MRPIVALSLPMMLLYPGNPVDCSEMTPKPAEWWLRPVIRAARVGEQSAVEWMLLNRRPAFAMRSIVGVGMTPPNVDGTPKPASSVMISSTLGAPFGGTIRGAHQGFDCSASSLMTPPNAGSGGGSCLPSIEVVAPGEPAGGGAGCCPKATAVRVTATPRARNGRLSRMNLLSVLRSGEDHAIRSQRFGRCQRSVDE